MFSNVLQALEALIGPVPPGYDGVAWAVGAVVVLFFVCSLMRLLGGFLSVFTGGTRLR